MDPEENFVPEEEILPEEPLFQESDKEIEARRRKCDNPYSTYVVAFMNPRSEDFQSEMEKLLTFVGNSYRPPPQVKCRYDSKNEKRIREELVNSVRENEEFA